MLPGFDFQEFVRSYGPLIGYLLLFAIIFAESCLVFTNTRSQTELWYQAILQARPDWAGIIALHHGSLDRSVRGFVEGAQTILLGTTPVQDLWNFSGPDSYNNCCSPFRYNSGVNFSLPCPMML